MRPPDEREKKLLACARRLVKLGTHLLGSWADGEDVAQEVLVIAIHGGPKGGQRWNGEGDAWFFVRGVLKNLVLARRRAQKRGTVDAPPVDPSPHVEEGTPEEEIPDSTPPPDSKNAERVLEMREDQADEDAERAALEAELENDPLARAVLALFDEGIDGESAQALRLGVPLSEIKKARRRLRDAFKRVRRKEKRS
jgi:DNA-directed RNA polymerase specialized sigma24 family protein